MDPKLKAIIDLIASKRKSSFQWKRQEPHSQPYYAFSPANSTWEATNPSPSTSTASQVSKFAVLSWNIDFMIPFANERMAAALAHLHSLVSSSSVPSIIMLQETLVSDLELIKSTPWIRSSYHLTDIDDTYWESGHYGTVSLVPKTLPITSVFRVHYEDIAMERDGLFVDVGVALDKPVRICNTHLESLIANPPKRPSQVATSAAFMHRSEVAGSVLGGDLNAIQPFDRTLHSDNGLQDAYLALGGKEDLEDGMTWGQMARVKERKAFGLSRMDKLFFCGDLECEKFESFGLGVEVVDQDIKKKLIEEEGLDGGWVTDHLGVRGEFRLARSDQSSNAKI